MLDQNLFSMGEGFPDEYAMELGPDFDPALPPEEEQEELILRLMSHYDQFKSDTAEYHKKIERWHKVYEAEPPSEKIFPWEGASNLSVPLARATVDSMQARISKAVFDVDPLWLTMPRTSEGVGLAKKAEAYLDYWADAIDVPSVLDVMIQGMLIEGVGVLKVDWLREYMQLPDGTPLVTYDAPGVSYIPARDFVLMPADSPTIDQATYTGHRTYLTEMQLEKRRDAEVYFNVDKLLEKGPARSSKKGGADYSGIVKSNSSNAKYTEVNQFEIVELYGPYDFGEGLEPALMTFSPEHKILLRLEPYPYFVGKSPYVDFKILPRPNFFWGFSMVEILESPQEELTVLHNARADAIALTLAPPIMRRHGAEWDPDVDGFQPGLVIPVADMAELQVMQMPNVAQAAFAHEQDLLAFVERVTGMNDYIMGRNAHQGRTATEVNRVTSEGLARLDTMVSRFQNGGMKKLGWMLWWLLYQFRPFMDYFFYDGEEFMITKAEKAPNNAGLMAFELQPHGVLSDVSKEARRQQKLMMFNTVAGVLSEHYPDGLQNLLRNIFHDFDIKDSDQILGPDWSIIQQQLQMAFQQGMEQGQQAAMQQVEGMLG